MIGSLPPPGPPHGGTPDNDGVLIPERVKTHWWRGAIVTAAVAVACFSASPFAAVFGVLPILLWSVLARRGVVTGLVLLGLLAWFVLPGALDLAGRWVPAVREVYWLHTTLAAVVCAIGVRRGYGRLAALVLAGFAATGAAWFTGLEAPPGDEGIAPGPAELRITEDRECGSGGCWRTMTATGDHAADVLREHLAERNYSASITGVPRYCRVTGIVTTHRVCADLRTLTPDTARLEWYLD
jgi:hypothetical protein